MSKRLISRALVVAAVAGAVAVPGGARAETCVPIPVSTTGITIEVGGEVIRAPSVSGVSACYQAPGTPGIPWVETGTNGGVSVLITAGSSTGGYVVLKYVADAVAHEVRAPVPGTGGGAERCLVGVGFPARTDCLVKVSPDNPVTPPPVSPPPIPTAGPLPTAPPVPTVPPVPSPTPPPPVDDEVERVKLLAQHVMPFVEDAVEDPVGAVRYIFLCVSDPSMC